MAVFVLVCGWVGVCGSVGVCGVGCVGVCVGVRWFLASIGDMFRFLPSKLGTHRQTGISPISSKGCIIIQYN